MCRLGTQGLRLKTLIMRIVGVEGEDVGVIVDKVRARVEMREKSRPIHMSGGS